jgi:hypothetical protein
MLVVSSPQPQTLPGFMPKDVLTGTAFMFMVQVVTVLGGVTSSRALPPCCVARHIAMGVGARCSHESARM